MVLSKHRKGRRTVRTVTCRTQTLKPHMPSRYALAFLLHHIREELLFNRAFREVVRKNNHPLGKASVAHYYFFKSNDDFFLLKIFPRTVYASTRIPPPRLFPVVSFIHSLISLVYMFVSTEHNNDWTLLGVRPGQLNMSSVDVSLTDKSVCVLEIMF